MPVAESRGVVVADTAVWILRISGGIMFGLTNLTEGSFSELCQSYSALLHW